MNLEIQKLGEKYVNAVDSDQNINIAISRNASPITEYDVYPNTSDSEVFQDERETINDFIIYGSLEYFSILNGLTYSYGLSEDFFKQVAFGRNIYNSFKVYLVAPTYNDYVLFTGSTYITNYRVLTKYTDMKILNAGYSSNLFKQDRYMFNINKPINLDIIDAENYEKYNNYILPITDLYLYFEYQPGKNGFGDDEFMYQLRYNTDTTTDRIDFKPVPLTIDSILNSTSLTKYDALNCTEEIIDKQEYEIWMPYRDENNEKQYYVFSYKPFIKIPLRVFEKNLKTYNPNDGVYIDETTIPYYAYKNEFDTYFWKNLMPKGYVNTFDQVGLNFPFLNGKSYSFNNIFLPVTPKIYYLFGKIFENSLVNYITDTYNVDGDIDNFNQPCSI